MCGSNVYIGMNKYEHIENISKRTHTTTVLEVVWSLTAQRFYTAQFYLQSSLLRQKIAAIF